MDDASVQQDAIKCANSSSSLLQGRIAGLLKICEFLALDKNQKLNLRKVTEALATVLDAAAADIYLKTFVGNYFVCSATFGDHFGLMSRGEMMRSGSSAHLSEKLESGQILFNDFEHPDQIIKPMPHGNRFGYKCAATAPIFYGETLIGMFVIIKRSRWMLSLEEKEYLLCIGKVLGISLYNYSQMVLISSNDSEELTEKEKKLIVLIAQGLSNEEISAELYLSSTSVKRQIRDLLDKLGLETRVQAAVYAAHAALI